MGKQRQRRERPARRPLSRPGCLRHPDPSASSISGHPARPPPLHLFSSSGRCGRQASGPSGWECWPGSGPAPGAPEAGSEPRGAQQVTGKPGGPRRPPEGASPAALPELPSPVLPSSHVSVSSLLHAMAVVPRADGTILGAAPGSPFPGNFLGTQTTPSIHFPGARAS